MIADKSLPSEDNSTGADASNPEDETMTIPQKRRRSDPITKDDKKGEMQSLISQHVDHTLKETVLPRLPMEQDQRFNEIQRQRDLATLLQKPLVGWL